MLKNILNKYSKKFENLLKKSLEVLEVIKVKKKNYEIAIKKCQKNVQKH